MRSYRAILVLVLLVAGALVGGEVALHALPFLIVIGLLVTGHFVGEERILAARLAASPPPPRRARARRWLPARPEVARSLFARAPRTLRGPPAALQR